MGKDPQSWGRRSGSSLPTGLTSFIGRGDELARVEELLGRHRLVSVVGPGGSGKTRLAVEAARRLTARFTDGVHMVELAQTDDPAMVAAMVAAALGVAEHQDLSMTEAVASVVGRRHLLLLLDNCEHVVDEVARLCETLLRAGDDLRILTTGREALGLPGEARFALGPLPVPAATQDSVGAEECDAVALFVERAARADSSFVLTPGRTAAVADLVRHLDGMPLAIELAAAQLDVLTLEDLTAGLADRFGVLVSHGRGVPPRQSSLAAAMEWSYRLLGEAEQRAFRRLAVFPAPMTASAAAAAVGPGGADLAANLARRSMLVPVGTGPDGRSRFGMLETLRAFGADRLDARERRDTLAAVARWSLAEAERMAALFDTPDDSAVGPWGDAEQENIRLVLDWLLAEDPSSALSMARAVAPWWFLRGHYREGRAYLEMAIERCVDAEPVELASAQSWAGRMVLGSGDFDGAMSHFVKCEQALPATGGDTIRADNLCDQAIALINLGRSAEATRAASQALDVSRASDYRAGELLSCAVLAVIGLYTGDLATARTWAEPAHHVDRESVAGHKQRFAAAVLGELLTLTGDRVGGERVLLATLDQCRRAGDRFWAAKQLDGLARLELATGRMNEAINHAAEAITIAFDIGDRLRLADCFRIAAVWAETTRPEDGAVLWGAYRTLAASIGFSTIPLVEIVDEADHDSAYDSMFVTAPMLSIRRRLGAQRAKQADDRGARMSTADAVEFALGLLDEPQPAMSADLRVSALSRRERELVDLVAEGLTDAQIAEKLFISIRTVRSHLDRIRDKTGCRRRAELTRLALMS